MPKLKAEDVTFDVDELEDAEYTEGDFETYDGDVPPSKTILVAFLKKMWWTTTQYDDDMIKVLLVAADNDGELEEYNGLPIWDNLPLITKAKFKWKPFIDFFGITLKDIKTKTVVSASDDNIGAPIEKIGTFKPGEENEDAWCQVLIKRSRDQDGNWRAEISKLLELEEPEEEDTEEEEPEEEAEEEEAEEEEEDVEEEEEPPAKPARSARGSRSARPVPASRTAAKAPAKTPAATSRTPARGTRTARTATAKASAKAAPPARRRRAAAAQNIPDEPPF